MTKFTADQLEVIREKASRIKGRTVRFHRGSPNEAMLAAAALATRTAASVFLFATCGGFCIEATNPTLPGGQRYTEVTAEGYKTMASR